MSTAPAPQPDNAVRWAHHPTDQLAHLAVHTPIQVPRGAADGHHPAAMLQPGNFQLQQGTPFMGLEQTAQYQRSFNFPVQNGGAFAQLSAAQLQQHNQAAAQQPNYELFAQRIAAEQQQQLQRLQQQPQIVDATWFDAQKTQSAWSEVQTSPQRPQLQRPQSAQQPQPPHSQMQLLSPQPAYHHALLSPTHGNPLWQQHNQSQRGQLHLTPPQSSPSSTVTTTPQNGLLSTVSVKRSPSVGEQELRRSPMAPQGARSCFTSPQPTMADNATVKREEHRIAEEATAAAATNENGQDSGSQQFEKLRTILDFEPDSQDRNEHNADSESVEKERSLEASRLLLNLSGSENSEPSGEENSNEEITVDCSDATAKDEGSSQPQHAQETSVDAVIRNVLTSIASPTGGAAAGATSTTTALENGAASSNGAKHRSYFRPPGLGAPTDASSDSNVLVCNVCGFSCTSKFHYNSHMNTHSDHKCSICNYTSRTEGRLKKHIMDSHTQEDRIAAGLDVPTNTGSNGCSDAKDIDKLQQELSSTMSSLLESANRIVATEANGETATSMTPTSVTVNVAVMNGDSIPQSSDSAFSVSNPLENIRALAEKNGLLNGAALDPSNLSSTLSGLLGGSDTNGNAAETSVTTGKKEQRRSGAGKPKQYRCKQCQHVSMTKEEQWRHARTHIPPEKQLTCELCEFVTEYKHHLEYHIRNHKGEKPFGCKECNYQCVNKSMLNSHMKSHNSLYQFKCMDCAYQTKYCHSLKMHLHKYNHRRAPGTVMSEGDANETDHFEDPSENGTSMALQQLSQQFRADPGVSSDDMQSLSNPVTSVRDTLRSILQPMVTSAPMQQQYAMQALRQQHIDRMQEMLRNANFNAMAMLPCQLCDFTTADRDELHRHQIAHVQQALASNNNPNLTGHPTLASLLANQNLQNGGPLMLPHLMPQQQQPLMAPNTLNSATLQQVNMLREHMARHYAANQDRSISDPQHSTALNHSSEYAAYGGSDERARPATETSHDADESSSSPTGSKMSVDESGSPASDIATDGTSRKRKQKKGKLEDTVKRLREKSSPESDEHEFSADSGHSDAAGSSTAIVASLPQPIPTSFFTSLSNTAPQERQRSSSAGYVCQHCAITFQDLALYQIHLGYHSFDNPFKCNRCGQVSPNSLQFNLHLYQEKHDMA